MGKAALHNELKEMKCCIIIPTFNNSKTLKRVVNGVLEYTSDIIIINDGSTDSTSEILREYPEIEQLQIKKNKGKGNALRLGFNLARNLGYKLAITIDSDGQHFPEDIPVFINAFKSSKKKELLLIGARNMNQEGIPKKSSFGNRFSNFWFWAETGIRLEDTQSGFRLYPIHLFKDEDFFSNKFEFEIEVIVKSAWRDIDVRNIPIQVQYDETERVSHFRPFKDFTRISILNTYLVILTIFYIWPRNLIRRIKKKGFKKFFLENFLGNQDSPRKKALSIALGVFIGLSPFWGFHTVIVIFLAIVLKLNKVIAFAFSNVSLPPFIPFVVFASLFVGNLVLGHENTFSIEDINTDFEFLKHLKSYVIGSFTLAILGSVAFGFLGYVFLTIFESKKTPHLSNG